jgi:hypothetical protein
METNQSLSLYQLPVQTIHSDKAAKVRIAHVGTQGQHQHHELGRVLMMVGGTGAGKTTLVNAIVNNLFGVQFSDNFRFKLVHEDAAKDQTKSVTDWITAYTIPAQRGSPVPFTLTIIDTPGFGDTGGIERDKFLVKQIHDLFSLKGTLGISHFNGIGFTAKSSDARLTPTQRYIFDSILSIFGNDVGRSIFVMTTFFDGQKPRVLDAIREAKIAYKQHFEFNSESVFTADDGMGLNHAFWKKAMEQVKTFLSHLGAMSSISIALTKEVLDERAHLEVVVKNLQKRIGDSMDKAEEKRKMQRYVDDHKADLERNKEFEVSVIVDKITKVAIDPGTYVTNCLNCNFTCHYPCMIPDDKNKKGCFAMEPNGYCRVCKNKCIWSDHVNNPYRIEWVKETQKQTSEELKRKYHKAEEGKSKYDSIMQGLQRDADMLDQEVQHCIQEAQRCVHRLEQIALKPNPISEIEYIEMLIEQEKNQKRRGYTDRIRALEKALKQAKIRADVKNM